jgi:hypothetical protein
MRADCRRVTRLRKDSDDVVLMRHVLKRRRGWSGRRWLSGNRLESRGACSVGFIFCVDWMSKVEFKNGGASGEGNSRQFTPRFAEQVPRNGLSAYVDLARCYTRQMRLDRDVSHGTGARETYCIFASAMATAGRNLLKQAAFPSM